METESPNLKTEPEESKPSPESMTDLIDLVNDFGLTEEEILLAQANAGNSEAAIAYVRLIAERRAAISPEPPFGYRKIRLYPPKKEIERTLRNVPRSLHLVDRKLADLFGRLCNGKEPWPLFIHGPAGTGKTMAALCFADMVGWSDVVTLEDIADRIMKGEWKGSGAERGGLLCVDEIGTRQKAGDLHYNALKGTLDVREARFGRVGVYISNLPPSALVDLFDDRIVSRLTCGTVFKLEGRDRRHG